MEKLLGFFKDLVTAMMAMLRAIAKLLGALGLGTGELPTLGDSLGGLFGE